MICTIDFLPIFLFFLGAITMSTAQMKKIEGNNKLSVRLFLAGFFVAAVGFVLIALSI